MSEPAQPPLHHPQATSALLAGVLGVLLCGLIAPFAMIMGRKVVEEIDSSEGTMTGRSEAEAGRILGIVGIVVWSVGTVALIVLKVAS